MPQPGAPGAMFEQLLVLRRCYARRSSYDRASDLTVAGAIAYAEWRMWLAGMRREDRPQPTRPA